MCPNPCEGLDARNNFASDKAVSDRSADGKDMRSLLHCKQGTAGRAAPVGWFGTLVACVSHGKGTASSLPQLSTFYRLQTHLAANAFLGARAATISSRTGKLELKTTAQGRF